LRNEHSFSRKKRTHSHEVDSKVVDEGCDPALPSPPRVPPTRANNYEKKSRLKKNAGRQGRADQRRIVDRSLRGKRALRQREAR
jgi:hypothetical protein